MRSQAHRLQRQPAFISVVVTALVTLLTTQLFALDPAKAITQFQHRRWGAEHGIERVRSICQTRDGYIWLASGNVRLLRFDGQDFKQWSPRPGEPGLPGALERVFATRDGSLWVSSASDLLQISAGHSARFNATNGMSCGHVTTMCEDSEGTIWAGGYLGICKFEGGLWNKLGPEYGLPSMKVRCLIFDREHTLWASFEQPDAHNDGGLAWLRAGEKRFEIYPGPLRTIQNMAEGPEGKIWVARPIQSVQGFTHDASGVHFITPEIKVGSQFIFFDRDHGLWITTLGDGLRRARNTRELGNDPLIQSSETLDAFSQKDDLSSDYLTWGFEDREGSLWFGGAGGVDCLSETKFANYSVREGLPFTTQLMLQATPDGNILVASSSAGSFNIITKPPAAWKRPPPQFTTNPLPIAAVDSLFLDITGEVIWGTRRGVYLPAAFDYKWDTAPAIFLDNVLAMTRDPLNGLWLCDREKGISRISEKDVGLLTNFPVRITPGQRDHIITVESHSRVPPVRTGEYVTTAYTDRGGRSWFAYSSGDMECLTREDFAYYSQNNGLVSQQIREILEDSKGRLWIVGSGGIGRFKDGRFKIQKTSLGLFGDDFCSMIEDSEGFFWLSETDGILRISSDELERSFEREQPVAGELFGYAEGLRGFVRQRASAVPGAGYPLATKGKDGRLWFSTTGGLAVVDPRHIPRNLVAPEVHIEKIMVGAKTNNDLGHLTIPPGARSCEIDFAGLSYVNPAKIRYKYKLEGADEEWIEAPATRRQALYSNLKPKKYKFQVLACNNDGLWCDQGDTVEFAIQPAFYETAWFPALCALPLALALWGIYRLRLSRITAGMRQQLEVQIKERKRIAQELHDTMLQGFIGIGLQLDAVANELPDSLPTVRERLRKILVRSNQCLDEARRSVWELRSTSLEKTPDFAEALADACRMRLDGTSIELDFSTSGAGRKLAPDIESNLLRICEEAVTNAVKHAHPTQVKVLLQFGAGEISLLVQDNGKGFNPKDAESLRTGHFGLLGLQERVQCMGGSYSLKSEPGNGTTILVTVRFRKE